MNKNDRKELQKAMSLLEEARSILDCIADQEQEKYDNLTDGLQQTDRGQQYEANAEDLNEFVDCIDNVIGDLTNII